MRPTRALWVPFPLGRPLGAPGQRAFQLDVLWALLQLLETATGPTIVDFPRDSPGADDDGVWACPVALPAAEPPGDRERFHAALLREAALLRPWYDEARRQRGRTSVGVSGFDADDLEAMTDLLARFGFGEPAPAADKAVFQLPELVKYVADDLKALYTEATAAQPGHSATPDELSRWIFQETLLGEAIRRVADRLRASSDRQARDLVHFLLPTVVKQGRRH